VIDAGQRRRSRARVHAPGVAPVATGLTAPVVVPVTALSDALVGFAFPPHAARSADAAAPPLIANALRRSVRRDNAA